MKSRKGIYNKKIYRLGIDMTQCTEAIIYKRATGQQERQLYIHGIG